MAPYRHLHISESPQTQYIAQPETNPSQILGRPRHNSSRIPIDSLQHLSQSPMAVILLIPHIFVVLNPLARPIPILLRRLLKTQSDEMVHIESLGRQPRSPGSLHFEGDRSWDVGVGGSLRG